MSKLGAFPSREILLIHPSTEDLENALEAWQWIGLDGLDVIAVSAFGDVFLLAKDEAVLHLDIIGGQLAPIAQSVSALVAKLADDDVRDQILLEGLVIAARNRGLLLAAGECYDFQQPPVLGGEMTADSIEKVAFVVKVDLAGQLHEQLKDLPPGTPIDTITIEN